MGDWWQRQQGDKDNLLRTWPVSWFVSFKVWAGNEDCEDVTWQECKLVERTVDFTVPKVDCLDDGNAIPYMRFVDTNKTQMLNKMTCEVSEKQWVFMPPPYWTLYIISIVFLKVKSAQSCKPVTSTKCATVEYQECAEAPVEECVDREVSTPSQVSSKYHGI